jgi:TolB-like protein
MRRFPPTFSRLLAIVLAWMLVLDAWPVLAAAPQPRPRVAVLPSVVTGELEDHWRVKLADRLLAGLVRGEFEVATIDTPEAAACADVDCRRELARGAAADYLVTSGIVAGERHYRVAVELVDGTTGSVLAVAARECDVCTVEEVGELLAEATTELRTKLDAIVVGPPIVAIDSRPRGAKVELDGVDVGITPSESVVAPGRHEATVAKEGYVVQRFTLRAVPGMREALSVELQAIPRQPVPPPASPRDLRPWGWSAVAVGVGTLAAGAALLAIDGRPDKRHCGGSDIDADGDCRYRYDSVPGGATLTAVGSAVVIGGITLLALHARRMAKHRRALRKSNVARGR